MVDVGSKPITVRTATAEGEITMSPTAFAAIREHAIKKGDVLAIAELAGTMACKRTADLVPLCHPLALDHAEVTAELSEKLPGVKVRSTVRTEARTGVEMEALTAVTIALLTVYDMAKSMDREMTISRVHLVEKTGGTSGNWHRQRAPDRGDIE